MHMISATPSFHILAKSIGAIRNLTCKYCFHLSKEQEYPTGSFRMTEQAPKSHICLYI